MSRCSKCNRPKARFDRWSLRYKGVAPAEIECLGFFKIKNLGREAADVELWPMNEHAAKMAAELETT